MSKCSKSAIENGKNLNQRGTKNAMKKLQGKRGITLIALVITIIVLLILAGVTIATLTGNNGILGQAQNASEVTDIAEVEELLQLEYANIMLEKLANNQDTTNELAMLGSAITSYNTLYPTKAPITPKQISGQIVVKNVTLDKQNLQIGVDTTTDAGHKGEITVAVDYEQGGGQTYVAEIQGKEYEVTVANHKVSIAKTPIVTSNAGGLLITADVADTTIATASVGTAQATETGSKTVVTVTGSGTAGNTTITITVNNTPYNVTLVAKASLQPGETADATETDNYTDTAGKTATVPKGYTVSNVQGEKLVSQGLVIRKDSNEYVWIEVPRTGGPDYTAVAGTTVDSNAYYTAIENALIAYAGFAKNGTDAKTTRMGWKDEWYDASSHTYDGEKWYSYDGTEDTSYTTGDPNSTAGCGLSYEDYNTQYKKMLKSVYTNGGFWIGRYEASYGGTNAAPLSQYNKDVQRPLFSFAQNAATIVATSDVGNTGTNAYTSSLMFGVQWDLVCKFLEGSTEWEAEHEPSWYIRTDSSSWGNYKPTSGSGSEKKTGISGYKRRNIYDFAGNFSEWTLEHATSDSSKPSATRGGIYLASGLDYPASYRGNGGTNTYATYRVSLY